tara:strand:- start:26205 stop:27335 length:1131 start_codon:yes stop_codon:yes gene_type:complete
MILGIAEDFTNNTILDSQLTSIPDSGMYVNSGVHPSITIDNLLSYLPNIDYTFTAYNVGTTYSDFNKSRKVSDIVIDGGLIYQSISLNNVGNTPASSHSNWQLTNIESLRIKAFIQKVKDRVYADLRLERRLVDSQYLYTEGTNTVTLPNDYAAWVFEAKGSDYVSFRINEISLQANTTSPVDIYVINQGALVTTLSITPNNGALEFKDIPYTFKGKGKWIFAIDSQSVKTNGYTIDPLNFDGFVAYTATGIGATPDGANYSYGTTDNGLGFNITAFLDSQQYIDNNMLDFGSYIRATFELMCFEMFLANAHSRSNREQRGGLREDLLIAELKEMTADSVIKRYLRNKDKAIQQLQKTLDRNIEDNNDFQISYSSI